ncbi:DUF4238 domain-containing protein [Dyella choica]|uniref:DUF4238 domain-containing protein n=1 Tax=Dyella choica TaxID=1927959 RepID=A0A432MA01_9GAMM|nr:DUF4238 domain-containing protein [Dyella choica]RUL78758.1 DUF4238 domain-containing protein [Dyella choica]
MNITRAQHFVWRRYLRAWADNELIWCLREGKVFRPNLMGIGQQRNFYEIREMTLDDIAWLRSLCAHLAPDVRSYALPLIGEFNELFAIKLRLLARGADPAALEKSISEAAIDLEEKAVQGVVEAAGEPYLAALLAGDTSFFRNVRDRTRFLHFLCVQYTRTRRMREMAFSGPAQMTSHNPEGIWNVLCHIVAAQLAASVVKMGYGLFVVRNNTTSRLVTADQPVINVHASHSPPGAMVESLDFYWPLSPSIAIVVSREPPDESEMPATTVADYNDQMARQALEQVYAAASGDFAGIEGVVGLATQTS